MTAIAGRRHSPARVTDRGRLAVDLAGAVRGEVRFHRGAQAMYASDASVFRQVPIGAVIPRDTDDVVSAMAACREHQVPVLARGCGTGLAGQSVNAAVVFDFSKYMHQILSLDAKTRTARVQPGVICDQLRGAASEHRLTFPVCGDSGTVTTWAARQIKIRRGQMFSFSGTSCSMAAGLPYAIGAQAAYPGRQVVVFTGDGSLTMQLAVPGPVGKAAAKLVGKLQGTDRTNH